MSARYNCLYFVTPNQIEQFSLKDDAAHAAISSREETVLKLADRALPPQEGSSATTQEIFIGVIGLLF